MKNLKSITVDNLSQFNQERETIKLLFQNVRSEYIKLAQKAFLMKIVFSIILLVATAVTLTCYFKYEIPSNFPTFIITVGCLYGVIFLWVDINPTIKIGLDNPSVKKLLEYCLKVLAEKAPTHHAFITQARGTFGFSKDDEEVIFNNAEKTKYFTVYSGNIGYREFDETTDAESIIFQTAHSLNDEISEKLGRKDWFWEGENSIRTYEDGEYPSKKTVYQLN